MTEPVQEMSEYCMRTYPIRGVVIDKQWAQFLTKELGFSSAPIGDMYFINLDGRGEVMPKKQFDRLFFKVEDDD